MPCLNKLAMKLWHLSADDSFSVLQMAKKFATKSRRMRQEKLEIGNAYLSWAKPRSHVTTD